MPSRDAVQTLLKARRAGNTLRWSAVLAGVHVATVCRRPLRDYAREAVEWVDTLSARQVGPGVAELLEAELAEMEPAP